MGSNIEPAANLLLACRLLAEQLDILAVSRVFETEPVDTERSGIFLNAALEVSSDLTPESLKYEVLRPLERQLGRVRTKDRNAPRTIDVDISLVGQRVFRDRSCRLEIPDPEILTRPHVAIPLADVAPDRVHPVTGQRLSEIAAQLDDSGIRPRPDLLLWPQEGDSN